MMSDGDGPMASVSFELTAEEWGAAGASHIYAGESHQAQRRNWRLGFLTLFGGLAAYSWATGGGLVGVAFPAAIAAAFIAAIPRMYRRSLLRSLTKAAATDFTHGLVGPHRVELWPHGVCDVTPASETLWRWASIDGVTEAEGTILIKVGSLDFLPVPPSAFAEGDAARRFGDIFFRCLAEAHSVPRSAAPENALPPVSVLGAAVGAAEPPHRDRI